MKTRIQRFNEKWDVEEGSGCWIWKGAKVTPWRRGATANGHGYGLFRGEKKVGMAHRFAYEHHRSPIPLGMVTDHLCRNTGCVNPWHLEMVSQRENLMRAPTALATRNVGKTTCPAGHPYSDANTYRYGTHRFCRLCAKAHKRTYAAKLRKGRKGTDHEEPVAVA